MNLIELAFDFTAEWSGGNRTISVGGLDAEQVFAWVNAHFRDENWQSDGRGFSAVG
jgi:hypothetical protein